jgi:hypothetical protein
LNETTNQHPDATHFFWLPPVSAVLFITLFLGMTSGSLARLLLGDSSTGWHIRNGEQILATGSIPHHDSFSATMSGRTWFAWEWLYDVAVGALDRSTGLNGVVWLTALVVSLTSVLLFRHAYFRSGNLPLALLLVLLSLCAATVHLLARPHIISWLLVFVWWKILEQVLMDGSTRRLVWLPLLMIVWVNVHGAFLLGFILTGIALASALWERGRKATSAPARSADAVAVSLFAVFVASFANPYGWHLHQHVYTYLTDRFLMRHIDEFRSPTFHFAAEWFFTALVLIAAFAMFRYKRGAGLWEILLTGFAIASGFYAYRNIPIASILLSMQIAKLAGEKGVGSIGMPKAFPRAAAAVSRLGARETGHLWLLSSTAVSVLIFAACLNGGRLFSRQVIQSQFDPSRLPVAATEKLAALDSADPVLAPDDWGGYLIYRLGPRIKPLVDDRHDLYGSAFLRDYLKVIHGDPGWKEILDRMHPNWVLLPPKSPLAARLRQTSGWEVIHEDVAAVLFQRHR